MKETILQYVRDYAPTFIMLIMAFVFKFGFGKDFSSFRTDVTNAFNVKSLTKELKEVKDELTVIMDDNRDLAKQIKELTEQLSKVKGRRKNEQQDERV